MPKTALLPQLDEVSIRLKANIYFDGKVISHAILLKNGDRKTVGLIYPGSYTFNTDAPERMDIVSGSCRVKTAGQKEWANYTTGQFFKVPGKSSFEITVEQGITEYLCNFE